MNYKILSVVTFIIAVTPAIVFAQTAPPPFRVLVGIPGITDPNSANIGQYINALYILSISIAALLAVIKIIIAGVKYMLSDVVTSKADAKSDIQGALVGLLIVISAVVILETINPQLRAMRLFLEPAAQAPGRPVRDTPTTNGAAPLPGRVAGATDEVVMCGQNSAGGTSCADAANQCYNNNGRVRSTIISRSDRITCEYGETVIIGCEKIDASLTATQQDEPDCSAARAKCPAGSTATQAGDWQVSCFTPFPPRPQADDRGTRGGA